jgi:membrane protein
VLLGASLASSMAAFRYQPVELRLPQGFEFYGLLRLLGRFQQARALGKSLDDDEILRLEPLLTDALLHDLVCELQAHGLLRRDENGDWLLARDLDQVSLSDLYEWTQLRIPVAEQFLPYRDDSLGRAALAALDELRLPLRERLKRRVSDIYPDYGDTP